MEQSSRILPRERLLKFGEKNLSNEELIAIILRTGSKDKNVLKLSTELLRKFNGSLIGIEKATVEELKRFDGIGTVKAVTLKALFELAKRFYGEILQAERDKIKSAEDVSKICYDMVFEIQERVRTICLDTKLKIISSKDVTIGTISSALIHPREVFREAVKEGASGVIVVHNHPSGDPTPSEDDKAVTLKLHEASKILEIKLIDHVIVAARGYYSFRENGLLGQ
ncbi:MAG TPA: JAB domain-containing protein [Thermotogaceae bacterium]|nr:JAB domain-containing protein [Thermotogaceae bacterium]